jgi:pyridoxine kinase
MSKVLLISSQVVHGHVGNSAATFVLQRFGHETLGLPTVILSNRPGYPAVEGIRLGPELLDTMLEAGLANGWLDGVDAIVTGYLPTRGHVELCSRWLAQLRARRREIIYFCDPILGDAPGGIYIDEDAAEAIRDALLPQADYVTPNAFELSWLSRQDIFSVEDAAAAAKGLARPAVLVTSAPGETPDRMVNLLVKDGRTHAALVSRRAVHAYGTGDAFLSFFIAYLLDGYEPDFALRAATASIDTILDVTGESSELALVASQAAWAPPP